MEYSEDIKREKARLAAREKATKAALRLFKDETTGLDISSGYRNNLCKRIRQADSPMRFAKRQAKELLEQAPEPKPERADYSDRTAKLANTYRKIAPDMQAADLNSTVPIELKQPRIRLGRGYNPDATFEPIPDFLQRHQAEK